MTKKIQIKPDAAERSKHWVRLTRLCNNRCVFCLDSDEQDGTVIPTGEALLRLQEGIEAGCDQAVLSGGEPTLHPDFFHIISESRRMGYAAVQVITNGRMFSYAGFLEKAVQSGLTEITFSIHETDPGRMDAQTGAPGSFIQTMKAFVGARNTAGLVVSVDIVWSAMNAGRLETIVSDLAALGATEFDILFPIPFGEAWANRDMVFFDAGAHRADIAGAIAFCEKAGLRIWTNRIPGAALEGAESYIQKPLKLHAEVAARREMFEALANRGETPPCRGDRCGYCHVQSFCLGLDRLVTHAGAVPLLVTPENVSRLAHPFPFSPRTLILDRAALLDTAPVREFLARTKANVEVISSGPEGLAPTAARDFSRMYVEINQRTAPALLGRGLVYDSGVDVILLLRNRRTLEQARDADVRISDFMRDFRRKYRVMPGIMNVPPCLTGAESFVAFPGISADVFRTRGGIDIPAFTNQHIEFGMYAKSARCAGCAHFPVCPGLHLNHVRAFGFSTIPGAVCRAAVSKIK